MRRYAYVSSVVSTLTLTSFISVMAYGQAVPRPPQPTQGPQSPIKLKILSDSEAQAAGLPPAHAAPVQTFSLGAPPCPPAATTPPSGTTPANGTAPSNGLSNGPAAGTTPIGGGGAGDGWWKPPTNGGPLPVEADQPVSGGQSVGGKPVFSGAPIQSPPTGTTPPSGGAPVGCTPAPVTGTTGGSTSPVNGPIPPPVSISPLPNGLGFLGDINSGLTILGNITNLASSVWNLVSRGTPSEKLTTQFVSVVPAGITDAQWSQLQCSYFHKNFEASLLNDNGDVVYSYVFGINLAANCQIDGVGAYLGKVTFSNKATNAGYDHNLNVDVTIPTIFNSSHIAGNPIATAVMHVQVSDSNIFTFREGSVDVEVSGAEIEGNTDAGDKHFENVSRSSDGSSPEPISPY